MDEDMKYFKTLYDSEKAQGKNQRSYDNQTPEDLHPPEPEWEDVEKWVFGAGFDSCNYEYARNSQGRDFVGWMETNWDTLVDWYIEDTDQ